jgi:hypothetical protein
MVNFVGADEWHSNQRVARNIPAEGFLGRWAAGSRFERLDMRFSNSAATEPSQSRTLLRSDAIPAVSIARGRRESG